jgi:DNA-binding NarL/FixJ family response regulator
MTLIKEKIKVVIADSQYLITKSLHLLIDEQEKYAVVGVATNFSELTDLLKLDSTLLITDFTTIDYNGFDGLAAVIRNHSNITVLVLTNQLDKSEFNALNQIGIKNILYKTTDPDELFSAMDAAVKKRKYYSDEVLELLIDESTKKSNGGEVVSLTTSEMDIVRFIAEGLTTKEIAARKSISFHTVMTHRKNIFRKLSVNSSSELIMYAIRAGWIDNIEYYI